MLLLSCLQVSHHPPISAFYVANRQDGFTISSSILAKSKFYGNSTSAILEGVATLTLLPRGEEYKLTMPYAHCKGILMGTLTMELGGKVLIECPKTGYSTEMEFKLRVRLTDTKTQGPKVPHSCSEKGHEIESRLLGSLN